MMMKLARIAAALGMLTLAVTSCTHHTSGNTATGPLPRRPVLGFTVPSPIDNVNHQIDLLPLYDTLIDSQAEFGGAIPGTAPP